MSHANTKVVELLRSVDLGSSVAEQDSMLENARIDTSAFNDLMADRVDLIPGSKGSGKTALYRIIVDFMQSFMMDKKRIVIAHGVRQHGDQVFHVFKDRFSRLTENDFVSFWCIYFISLANEFFVKAEAYSSVINPNSPNVVAFKGACAKARLPNFTEKRTLKDVLDWALDAVQSFLPKKATVTEPQSGAVIEFDLFGNTDAPAVADSKPASPLPLYTENIKIALEGILHEADLNLWLMVDRLDEIFPRRSLVETRALRALLRVVRVLESPRIKVKIFLRDDILDQITERGGFTALTHVAARRARPLSWSEDQILCLICRRLYAHNALAKHLEIDVRKLTSVAYAKQAFYRVFPQAVYQGAGRITTLRWIYSRCADGRGNVTPRDVIDLVTKAIQFQVDESSGELRGKCESMLSAESIRSAYQAMSRDKTVNYLKAEFPNWWPHIQKFKDGKTEYSSNQIEKLLGENWERAAIDLVSIGVLKSERRKGELKNSYKIPFLYRPGLNTTQGKMRY